MAEGNNRQWILSVRVEGSYKVIDNARPPVNATSVTRGGLFAEM